MLPFLKKQHDTQGGVIEMDRTDLTSGDKHEEDSPLEAVAKEFIAAVEAKDYKRLASIWQDAHTILESQPHAEGPEPTGEMPDAID